MQLTIRADGGPDIGFGHLVRTAAIAMKVLNKGHTVTYATTTHEAVRYAAPAGCEVHVIESRSDPKSLVRWIKEAKPDIVLTDAYPVDTTYQSEIREKTHLAVLSDDTRHPICADLLINGNLYAKDLKYEFVRSPPKQLLGSKYVPLREPIRERADQIPPWRERPEHALITMGGSDMAGLTPTVIRAFDGSKIAVDAIVGPGFSDRLESEIRKVADEVSADVNVSRDPDDLPQRMFEADFAVSTSSTTTYELLALGTPIVSVPVAANQERIAASLRERNAATVLNDNVDELGFEYAIEDYLTNPTLRQKRREWGREIVDGMGTQRIVTTILELIES